VNIGEILIYQNTEGSIKIDVRLEEKTVWLTQDQTIKTELRICRKVLLNLCSLT
jgi:hypothetical protein